VRVLLAVLWKDLLVEWRSRDRVAAMAVFALLVVVIFQFAAPPGATPESRAHLPGLLWVAWVFSAVLGLNRAFALELENDAWSGLALAPADRGWIYLGKALAGLAVLLVVQALSAGAFALAFDLPLGGVLPRFAAVALLGAIGVSAIGTLFAAVSARTRYREAMLPLLLLPLLVPVVLAAVRSTAAVLEQQPLPAGPLRVLLVTDAVFLILSFVCFEYVLDE
jgi:heme exporter protein B